jgi:hypothetical protein
MAILSWRSVFVVFSMGAGFLPALLGTTDARAGDFIVLGDLPYTDTQKQIFHDQIVPAIQAEPVPFVIHVGDFKGSKEVCSDGLFLAARDTLYGLKPGRVFFTPGDNDWTDCDRDSSGLAMREYDRLSRLRQIFFDPAPDSPRDMGVLRQDGYPENARWMDDGVAFATLHVVGTNNGRRQIYMDKLDFALDQVTARDHANSFWLDEAVNHAILMKATALVIAMHADITTPMGTGACDDGERQKCDAYAPLRDQLGQAAKKFGGPMLLIHGDTNPYCLEQDSGRDPAPNLWWLNAAGDYAIIDAVKVTVQPEESEPFVAQTILSGESPRKGC